MDPKVRAKIERLTGIPLSEDEVRAFDAEFSSRKGRRALSQVVNENFGASFRAYRKQKFSQSYADAVNEAASYRKAHRGS